MIKSLQLYTVCIVIVVIGLSIFSYFNTAQVGADINTNQTKVDKLNNDNLKKEAIDNIKESKYAKPYRELLQGVEDAEEKYKWFKQNINEAKEYLDIEKDINKLNKIFE